MDHETIVKNYARRMLNSRNQVEWGNPKHYNVYCQGRVIFSYGSHFPMAYYLGKVADGEHHPKGGLLFLKNGDRYSVSTSRHQGMVQDECEGPTISFAALDAAGMDAARIAFAAARLGRKGYSEVERPEVLIVDYSRDQHRLPDQTHNHLYRDRETGHLYDGHPTAADARRIPTPAQGMFVRNYGTETDRYVQGYWHILGAALLRDVARKTSFLCGLDEDSYFISQLKGNPKTVAAAFEALCPIPVRRARAEGKAVQRQGEWFCVPTGLDNKALAAQLGWTVAKLKEAARVAALPKQAPTSNEHVVRHFSRKGKIYAIGRMFHRNPKPSWDRSGAEFGPLSREHATLRLGDEWHLLYRNTEVRSWSRGGKFD